MDANGVGGAVFAITAAGQPYLRLNAVGQDVPPANATASIEINGVLAKCFDPATNSLRVTGV